MECYFDQNTLYNHAHDCQSHNDSSRLVNYSISEQTSFVINNDVHTVLIHHADNKSIMAVHFHSCVVSLIVTLTIVQGP